MITIIDKFKHQDFKEIFASEVVKDKLEQECKGKIMTSPKIYSTCDYYELTWETFINNINYYFNLSCVKLENQKFMTFCKKSLTGLEIVLFSFNYDMAKKLGFFEYTKKNRNEDIYRLEKYTMQNDWLKYLLAYSYLDVSHLSFLNIERKKNYFKQYLYFDNFCTLDPLMYLNRSIVNNAYDEKYLSEKELLPLLQDKDILPEDEYVRKIILNKK